MRTFAVVLLVLGLSGAVMGWGVPEGAVGTIDFRYPDYIVEPLVECPFEGVFPHPHNCTWYYRCYDRYGYGFFWRAYFQCEPGTVFSDELDQCVFAYDNDNCSPTKPGPGPDPCTEHLSQCSSETLCPSNSSSTVHVGSVEICRVAEKRCGEKSEPICSEGYFYSKTGRECIESGELCGNSDFPTLPSLYCMDEVLGCEDLTVCSRDKFYQVQRSVERQCDIQQVCYRNGKVISKTPLCSSGQAFNAFLNVCEKIKSDYENCPSTTSGNPPLPTGYPPLPSPVCTTQKIECTTKKTCNGLEYLDVCSKYFSCSSPASSANSYVQRAGHGRWYGYIYGGLGYGGYGDDLSYTDINYCVDLPEPVCKTHFSNCAQQLLCPSMIKTQFVNVYELCDTAYEECTVGESVEKKSICDAGYLYSSADGVCYPPSTLCTTATAPAPESPVYCKDQLMGCKETPFCQSGSNDIDYILQCDMQRSCFRDEVEVSKQAFCPSGQKFDATSNNCAEEKLEYENCPSNTLHEPIPLVQCARVKTVYDTRELCEGGRVSMHHLYFTCVTIVPVVAFTEGMVILGRPPLGDEGLTRENSCITVPEKDCEISVNYCTEQFLCANNFTTMHVSSFEVCRVAEERCGTQTRDICPGSWYNKVTQQCHADGELCYGTNDLIVTNAYCTDVVMGCKDLHVCEGGSTNPTFKRHCDIERVCFQDGSEVSRMPLCSSRAFDVETNECADVVEDYQGCPGSVMDTYPIMAVPVCENVVFHCKTRPICGGTGQAQSCKQYFTCMGDRIGTSLFGYGTRYYGYDEACIDVAPVGSCSVEHSNVVSPKAVCPRHGAVTMHVRSFLVSSMAIRRCGDTLLLLCPAGYWYNLDQGTCISEDDFCTENFRAPAVQGSYCEDVVDSCQDIYVCEDQESSVKKPVLRRQCDVNRVCYNAIGSIFSKKSLCPGQIFNAFSNTCEDIMKGGENCRAPPSVLELEPVTSCTTFDLRCVDQPLCSGGGQLPVCYLYFRCGAPDSKQHLYYTGYDKPRAPVSCLNVTVPSKTCDDKGMPQLGDCRSEALCAEGSELSSSSRFVPREEVCYSAEWQCTDGSLKAACEPGQVYVKSWGKCISGASICEVNPREFYDVVCADILQECEDYYVCNDDPWTYVTERACKLNRVCRNNAGVLLSNTTVCAEGSGMVFDYKTNECAPKVEGKVSCSVKNPSKPVKCQLESETCVDKCFGQKKLTALSCKRQFSCEPNLFSASVEISSSSILDSETCESMTAPVTCGEVLSDCSSEPQCPSSYQTSQFVPSQILCQSALKDCTNGTRLSICPAGVPYDATSKTCVAASSNCGQVMPRPDYSVTCEDVVENCQETYSCKSSTEYTRHQTCDLVRVCHREGKEVSRKSRCEGGKFDVNTNQCVPAPAGQVAECGQPGQVKLSCSMVHEQCSEAELCISKEKILSCHQLFQCGYTSVMPSTLRNTYQPSEGCVILTGEPKCQLKTSDCSSQVMCPQEFSKTSFTPMVETCREAFMQCTNGTTTDMCPSGKLYDVASGGCVDALSNCKTEVAKDETSIVCKDELINCTPKMVCPDGPSSLKEVLRCDLNTVCSGNGFSSNKSLCSNGRYDAYTNTCVDESLDKWCTAVETEPLPEPQCGTYAQKCYEKPLCSGKGNGTHCVQIFSCTGTIGKYARFAYARDDDNCIGPSSDEESVTTSLNCNYEGQIPFNNVVKKLFCDDKFMCNYATGKPKYAGRKTVCKKFYTCVERNEKLVIEESTCGSGRIFDFKTKSCISSLSEGTVRECNTAGAATEKPPALELVTESPSSTPSTSPSSTSTMEPVEQFTESSSIMFNCTQDREIPDNQQIRHANCDTKALCTPDGRFKENKELCEKYYVCRWAPDSGHYQVDTRACTDAGQLYSYDTNACEAAWTGLCG